MDIETNIPETLLRLPEYVPVTKTPKSNNNVPDVKSLTPEQKEVYDVLIAYLGDKLDPSIEMISLKGYAGTGKSYVITQVMKWYVMMIQNNIAVTAPTNKAVKVLRSTANFEHQLITYATIHKLLGLVEKTDDDTGKQQFVKDPDKASSIDDQSVVIIDETSMLPDELFDLVRAENQRMKPIDNNRLMHMDTDKVDDFFSNIGKPRMRTYDGNLKVIFLGDPLQIPPIGKADCIPFNENNTDEYGIKTLMLTEIIRQKEGNPILELATNIREHYTEEYIDYNRETVSNEIGSVCFINRLEKPILYNLCEIYFSSKQFEADSDFMKVISWTNATVGFMNNKIRSYIHKEKLNQLIDEMRIHPDFNGYEEEELKKAAKLPRILVGEKLIANKPIFEDTSYRPIIIFKANDEFEVLSYKITRKDVFENYTVDIYETKVSYMDYGTARTMTRTINILHENSLDTFTKVLEALKQRAINTPKQGRGMAWKIYYMMQNKFADVIYNYSLTAHKAQGSTYENCIVIVSDIDKNRKVEERNRIKYVALTRAKTNLFIVE